MSISAVKVFIAGEVLFASDLNDEFGNIYDNEMDVGTPRTDAYEMAGYKLKLDSDGNTSIRADTNDQIDVEIGGTDTLQITATDIQFLGESLVQRGELRRLGVSQMIVRLGTLEARVSEAESNALTISQLTNF